MNKVSPDYQSEVNAKDTLGMKVDLHLLEIPYRGFIVSFLISKNKVAVCQAMVRNEVKSYMVKVSYEIESEDGMINGIHASKKWIDKYHNDKLKM